MLKGIYNILMISGGWLTVYPEYSMYRKACKVLNLRLGVHFFFEVRGCFVGLRLFERLVALTKLGV